jgi:hypothetical protein
MPDTQEGPSRRPSARARPDAMTRRVGMYTLRGYLIFSALMLVVKAIEVSAGH